MLKEIIRPLQRLFSRTPVLSREETLFRAYVVADLDESLFRRLLAIGHWSETEAGTVLVREREIVTHMIFVAAGEVEITVEGKTVGYCDIGSLVGEISVLMGTPATATATARSKVTYLAFERGALLALMESEPRIGRALDETARHGLRQKLASANEALARAQAEGTPPQL